MNIMNKTVKKENIRILLEGTVASPKGFTAGGLHCGIKRKRKDLGRIYSHVPANAAGIYTTNQFQAAPLQVTQDSLSKAGKLQAVLVNSGNANAFTGPKGVEDAYQMRHSFSESLKIKEHLAAVVSTGVIGELLPMNQIHTGIHQIPKLLSVNSPSDFEKAILTTDTFSKNIAVQLTIDNKTVTIGGAAKGSGMIHPNMATMLGFVTTDVNIEHHYLQLALREVADQTFNCISVDGDSSTNDLVLIMANGLAKTNPITTSHPEWYKFMEGLKLVCESLAKQIARDGEGATKLIEVLVNGAKSAESARKMAKTIISSNLVKTAIHGEDPNWGRIVCAIGYSEVPIDPNSLSISIGNVKVIEQGIPLTFSEAAAKAELEKDYVIINVQCDEGDATGYAWGCDLSYEYVRINASYRT